jgi:two-component system cell cycle sensor histidine kinase/response regulator CckA
MPNGGLLRLGVHVRDESVELTVQDTGIGMDEATIERIFEPFFTTKDVGAGTGLGLSTVEGIVAQLGGSVEVQSAPGAGSTFTVAFPLDLARPTSPVRAAAPAAIDAADGSVLLVEDEDIVRHVTEEMLKLSGYEVVSAASAEDALTLLALGTRPDVLVSDVLMTGIDGPALAARAREILPGLPVLFISGYSAEALGDRTSETVLTKPFSAAELGVHVEQVRRAAASAFVAAA